MPTTLTVFTDANPVPRVLVTITGLLAGTQTITLYRTAEGRQMKVRGGVNLFAVGGAAVMDYEAPFGVPLTYRAEQFDASGLSLNFGDAATTTLTPPLVDTSYVWIHQPLNPSLAIVASMRGDTAADVSRRSPGSLVYTEGGTVGVQIGGQRQGIAGLPFSVVCRNGADADKFLDMFGGYSTDYPAVICIRSMPPVRIPRVFFGSVSETHEVTDYSLQIPFITFAITVDEVRPPSPGLILPSLRRKDIDFAYATRAARAAAYATRLARDSDYSLAGVAGP